MKENQTHPLYTKDRALVDSFIIKKNPSDEDLVNLARLINRYDFFPGANDIKFDLEKTLSFWNLTRDSLNNSTRNIWSNNFKPGQTSEGCIGSGFDASDNLNE